MFSCLTALYSFLSDFKINSNFDSGFLYFHHRQEHISVLKLISLHVVHFYPKKKKNFHFIFVVVAATCDMHGIEDIKLWCYVSIKSKSVNSPFS